MRPSRRQLLQAGVVLTAACTTSGPPHRTPSPSPADPDLALLADAQARETALLAAYDEALAHASSAELATYRADHAAHLAALIGATRAGTPSAGSAPAGTPTPARLPAPTAGVRQQLAALEHQAAHGHATGTGLASAGLAALLSSLAACEASHAALLS